MTIESRPWLVGEHNPYARHHRYDLYPEPQKASGWRLCSMILGLSADEYLQRFHRWNLVNGGPWSKSRARWAAFGIEVLRESMDTRAILLGAKVAEAFGLAFTPYEAVGPYLMLPHPSGRNRCWNEPGAMERARTAAALHLVG